MKNRPVLFAAGAVGLIVVLAVAWYLASPLFINRTVDEAFPFELPGQAELDAMSEDEMKALEAEFMAAVPSEDELNAMPADTRAEVEEQVMASAAAVMSDKVMVEEMPATAAEATILAQGQFVGADSFHQGSGNAAIYELPDGSRVLRFEDFTVTNGPDLHVILTRHPAPASRSDVGEDYVDLGQIKGNVGNQNYDIPTDVDLSQYRGVVIYCKPFHVVFATATLDQ